MKFIYKQTSQVEEGTIQEQIRVMENYVAQCRRIAEEQNYEASEASLCLVDDLEMLKKINELIAKKTTPRLKYIIDIGIGGSNLGTKAVYEAQYGERDNLRFDNLPKILFLDTTDPEYIDLLSRFIKKNILSSDEFLVNIISKSGGTTETAVNGEIIIALFKQKFENWKERFVVTTDKHSTLWDNAIALGIDALEIPKKVGGRYSVFSAVGLFPLGLCGIDIQSLLKGALIARDEGLKTSTQNSALISAIILNEHLKKGVAINDNFYFHSELESLGKWYRQLMGESTGKGGQGLTPTVSMGSVDLHSVVQLYLGGPKNKITSFVYTDTFKKYSIPTTNTLTHIKEIEGKEVGSIMGAIQKGTIKAYSNVRLPLTETILEGISLPEIGAYMQFKMMEIMFLGQLMSVNAFDQPQVELYKIETKKILAEK
jgi:glucose-6-phosphate isomerase